VRERALGDTGPLIALYSEHDADRERCRQALDRLIPPLLTCWPVLTEAAWILRKRPEGLQRIFAGFSDGLFALLSLDSGDLAAIAGLMRRYESSNVQFCDVALAHLAEREGIHTVFTLDWRDFSMIRLERNRALTLIPDLQ
jgi:predicted nucleic acid-binding protein